MRARTVVAALGVAPLLALLPAAPASAAVASCSGVGPVIDSCSTTGSFGADPYAAGVVIGCALLDGTVTARVVTSTMTFTVWATCKNAAVTGQGSSQSGYPQAFQIYTLYGSATGTGYWEVSVQSL